MSGFQAVPEMKLLMEGYQAGWIVESKETVEVELPQNILEREGCTGQGPVKRTRVTAVVQEADTPNQNGRAYPQALFDRVLREGSEFTERLCKREVLGELEHPECLASDDFRVLTSEGWKPFRAIKVGDKVWSRINGAAVLSRVNRIIDEPYSGLVFHVKGRAIDAVFTPNHRFVLKPRTDRPWESEDIFEPIGTIAANRKGYCKNPVPRTAEWTQVSPSTITIPPAIPNEHHQGRTFKFVEVQSTPLELDAKLFAGFMGIYLAEGHCQPDAEVKSPYRIVISQKNDWSKKLIWDEILSKFPAEIVWRNLSTGWATTDARLWKYLHALGVAHSKYIPREVMELSPEDLQELIYWFAIGDGRIYPSSKLPPQLESWEANDDGPTFKEAAATAVRQGTIPYTRMDLHTVSERLVRDLHEVVVRLGGCGILSTIEPDKDYEFAGRTIKAENKRTLWQLRVLRPKQFYLDPRFTVVDPQHHEGHVFCLSVDHGNFYMEQNGRSFWTGNSGNTHLGRVSHLWERIWPQGNKIYGECLILRTPEGQKLDELVKVGHPLGFSSRGRGEVTSRPDGIEEVKVDDYFLDTFDAVAKPSVATARMEQAMTGEEVILPGVVRTESREESAPMTQMTAVFPAAQMLARAETTMNGVQESLARDQDISSLVEAQSQVSGLLAEMGAYPAPAELREQYAEIRGRLKEASTGIGKQLQSHKRRKPQAKGRLVSKRDKAASEIIEALMERNKCLRQRAASAQRPVVDDSRYEVAVQLGEELLRQGRQLQEERDYLREQLDAAVELVEAVVSKTKNSKTQARKKLALQNSLISQNKQARALLESCRTPQEVDQAVTLIGSLMKSQRRPASREKLPPLGGNQQHQLAESRQKQGFPPAVGGKQLFGESLMGHLAKREARVKADTLHR